jgi:hypothetical protein
MSHHREILAALAKLKSGTTALTSEQYGALLEALEQAAEALHIAPRGSDPIATGLWWNHERAPALARLADVLSPRAATIPGDGKAGRPEATDAQVVRALHQSLLDNTVR